MQACWLFSLVGSADWLAVGTAWLCWLEFYTA
jgi:hypothetical protein